MHGSSELGVSLVEATVIVAMVAALAATLSPTILVSLDDARRDRVRSETRAIASGLSAMLSDTGEDFLLRQGHGAGPTDAPSRAPENRVHLLVTDGVIPAVVRDVARASGTDWHSPLDADRVMSFYAHLVANAPGYRSPAEMTGFEHAGAGGHIGFGWRGAYLAPSIGPDPWGRRYAANVELLGLSASPSAPAGSEHDVIVLSAGPNGRIETPFAGVRTGLEGDDFAAVVSRPSR